jgi:hypothetical protein
MTNHEDKSDNFSKRKRKTKRNAQPSEMIARVVSGPRPYRDSPVPCARFVYSDISTKGQFLVRYLLLSDVSTQGLKSKADMIQGPSFSPSRTASSSSSAASTSSSSTASSTMFLSRNEFNKKVDSSDSDSSDEDASLNKSQKVVYHLSQCSLPV